MPGGEQQQPSNAPRVKELLDDISNKTNNLYHVLSKALENRPRPESAEDWSRFIIRTLHKSSMSAVEVLLRWYNLPIPKSLHYPVDILFKHRATEPEYPQRLDLQTLPVNWGDILAGDSFKAYVEVKDFSMVPTDVQQTVESRWKALKWSKGSKHANQAKSFKESQTLKKAGYCILTPNIDELFTRVYTIKLRGVAPLNENQSMHALLNAIRDKSLNIIVYYVDHGNRCVGDVYADGVLVQNLLLKKGVVRYDASLD